MSGPPDFRMEQSELRADDEFAEFDPTDLPYYSDWRGSFEKLPWATDDETLRAASADVAIVGAPLDEGTSSRPGARFGPRAIRMAPTAWGSDYAWSIQLDVEPYAHLTVVDAGDAPVVPTRFERGLRVIHEKVFRVASAGRDPDRARRRPFDHLPERRRRRAARLAAQGRRRALRRARRHRRRPVGEPATATASRCAG